MTQPAPFEVTPDRPRDMSTGERAARRLSGMPPADVVDEVEFIERTVSVRAVLDSVGTGLITGGFAVGDTAAWMAGGKIPGLATLGGALIAIGVVLTYR